MKKNQIKTLVIAVSLIATIPAQAQFGMPSIPGLGSGSNNTAKSTESAAQVIIKTQIALANFVAAQKQLDDAINGTNTYEASKALLDRLAKGDAAASKEDFETVVSMSKEASEALAKDVSENKKLEAKNKSAAQKAMVNYVIALVSTKSLINSIQGLAGNPMSAGTSIGTLTYLVSQMPTLISSGAGSTANLFKYLTANGVDMKEAQKAADGLGK